MRQSLIHRNVLLLDLVKEIACVSHRILPNLWEETVKLRLLLTSVLFVFAQMPTMRAQVTVDVSKITCEQVLLEKLPWTESEGRVVA